MMEVGNQIEEVRIGLGDSAPAKTGWAKQEAKYDSRGRKIEVRYFDLKGEPVITERGYARQTGVYDDRDNLIEERCFGVDSNPILSVDGYARLKTVYDALGRKVEVAFFGLDDSPILVKDGYAQWNAKNLRTRKSGRTRLLRRGRHAALTRRWILQMGRQGPTTVGIGSSAPGSGCMKNRWR